MFGDNKAWIRGDIKDLLKAKREAAHQILRKAKDEKEVVSQYLESDYTSKLPEDKEWNNLSDISMLNFNNIDPKLIIKHTDAIKESVKKNQNIDDSAKRIKHLSFVASKFPNKSIDNPLFSPEFIFLVSIVMIETTSLQDSFDVNYC